MSEDLLAERQTTHGQISEVSACAQATKLIWQAAPNWNKLNVCQQEALEMIASKVEGILNGDPGFADHWRDIAGYAQLALPRGA
jgi:hypothetical protein